MKKIMDFEKRIFNESFEDVKAGHEWFLNVFTCCGDVLAQNDFGFVSKYKGEFYLLRKDIVEPDFLGININRKFKLEAKHNNKLKLINQQYRIAEMASRLMGEYVEFLSMHNLKFVDSKERTACKKEIKRILDACLVKGFQYPVINGLSYYGWAGIDGTDKEILRYIEGIEKNYARKHAYSDFKASYLKEEMLGFECKDKAQSKRKLAFLQKAEANEKEFRKLVMQGQYGEEFDDGTTLEELDARLENVYKKTLENSKANVRVKKQSCFDGVFGYKEYPDDEQGL
ncbi:MAG: hypothetical protein J6A28_00400 [Clostridia bacterium]|nr:hypothetical protein [Clostridia bacterium]